MKSGKGIKCYVLTVLEYFPAFHPKAGMPTDFARLVEECIKRHTCRGDFEKWKRIADEVNRGKAYVSIRVWVGEPYGAGSTQRELLRLDRLHVQHLYASAKEVKIDGKDFSSSVHSIASNDGLSLIDFSHWLCPGLKKTFDGAIIQFSNFKY